MQDRSSETLGIPKNVLGPYRRSLEKGRLRRQLINLAPPERVGAWEDGSLRLDKMSIGDARGVMVIVIGNGHGDTSSNPEQD